MAKIIFFTAGQVPTVDEQAEIDAIASLCVQPYTLAIRRGDIPGGMNYGVPNVEQASYAAGTIPAASLYGGYYDDLPVFDPDDEPHTITVDDTFLIHNSHDTVTVSATIVGTVVGGSLPDTVIILSNAETLVIKNTGATATVTAAITSTTVGGNLADTICLLPNSANVNVKNSAGSVTKAGVATVASGAISGVALASTVALDTNGATVPVITAGVSTVTGTVSITGGALASIIVTP